MLPAAWSCLDRDRDRRRACACLWAKSLGTGRSIEELARNAGWRVRIAPKLSVADGINAVCTLFPNMWFDRNRSADGVQAPRHDRYDVDSGTGQFSRQPPPDLASNGSDALRYLAVAMQGPRRAQYIQRNAPPPRGRRVSVTAGRGCRFAFDNLERFCLPSRHPVADSTRGLPCAALLSKKRSRLSKPESACPMVCSPPDVSTSSWAKEALPWPGPIGGRRSVSRRTQAIRPNYQ
jgi:hypothetical protein